MHGLARYTGARLSSLEYSPSIALPTSGSLTERVALRVMRTRPAIAAVAPADDPVHLLNADERIALRRIERAAVFRAALAGALSALASAIASVVANLSHPTDGVNVSMHNLVTYWGWVGTVTLIASIIEIGFLYWDALRAVHQMACAAGLPIGATQPSARNAEVLLSLARAALELPNPLKPLAEIDPRRESNRLLIILASLVYKAKVTLTTFVTKALLRSALGRTAARAVLDFVAVPVTAGWNAAVCYFILREARLRILGPSAIVELIQAATRDADVSRSGWVVAQRAVASAVVRSRDFHPNHLAVIQALNSRVPLSEVAEPDDTRRFIREIAVLARGDQRFALHVLVTAAALDGRLTRAEQRLLREAFEACHRNLDMGLLRHVVRTFRAGKPVTDAIESAVAHRGSDGVRVESAQSETG